MVSYGYKLATEYTAQKPKNSNIVWALVIVLRKACCPYTVLGEKGWWHPKSQECLVHSLWVLSCDPGSGTAG